MKGDEIFLILIAVQNNITSPHYGPVIFIQATLSPLVIKFLSLISPLNEMGVPPQARLVLIDPYQLYHHPPPTREMFPDRCTERCVSEVNMRHRRRRLSSINIPTADCDAVSISLLAMYSLNDPPCTQRHLEISRRGARQRAVFLRLWPAFCAHGGELHCAKLKSNCTPSDEDDDHHLVSV